MYAVVGMKSFATPLKCPNGYGIRPDTAKFSDVVPHLRTYEF
jgi:hypothetical protein